MSLQAILKQEAFDALSDSLKSEYKKQQDGTFLLDVTPVNDFALENVKGLKTALSSERSTREELEKKFKAFDGLEVDKAREALRKVEEMASWKPEDKVKEQIEAIKNQLIEKHKGELGARDGSIQSLNKQLEKVLIDAESVKAISENKGSSKLLLPHVRGFTRMKKLDNGEFAVEVIDEKGQARISPTSGSTAPMSISELIAEMKTQDAFAPAFEGSGASGSGARPGFNGGAKVHTISAAESKDPARYRTAKAEAEKAGVQLQIADS